MKKRLLIATDNFLPRWDGISRFLSGMIPYLKEEFDITLLAPHYEGSVDGFDDIEIIRFQMSKISFGDIHLSKPSKKEILKHIEDADIVWTQSIGPIGVQAILCASKLKKPIVSYIHSIEWELFSKSVKRFKHLIRLATGLVVRWLYNKCSLLVVPTLEVKELMTWKGIRTKKEIVHLGIDTDKFVPSEDKSRSKEYAGFPPDSMVIGFTGRIAREKDLMTLYLAFRKLREGRKDLKLLIVGDGIEEQMKLFEAEPNVKITGSVNNVVPYLQAMDVYVLPSLTETSSLSTMEAMSCGLPVVVTKVGMVKRYVYDKLNGVFFPKKNELVLSLKLKWLLEEETVREKLGKNARRTIIDKFQWKKTVEEMTRILKEF